MSMFWLMLQRALRQPRRQAGFYQRRTLVAGMLVLLVLLTLMINGRATAGLLLVQGLLHLALIMAIILPPFLAGEVLRAEQEADSWSVLRLAPISVATWMAGVGVGAVLRVSLTLLAGLPPLLLCAGRGGITVTQIWQALILVLLVIIANATWGMLVTVLPLPSVGMLVRLLLLLTTLELALPALRWTLALQGLPLVADYLTSPSQSLNQILASPGPWSALAPVCLRLGLALALWPLASALATRGRAAHDQVRSTGRRRPPPSPSWIGETPDTPRRAELSLIWHLSWTPWHRWLRPMALIGGALLAMILGYLLDPVVKTADFRPAHWAAWGVSGAAFALGLATILRFWQLCERLLQQSLAHPKSQLLVLTAIPIELHLSCHLQSLWRILGLNYLLYFLLFVCLLALDSFYLYGVSPGYLYLILASLMPILIWLPFSVTGLALQMLRLPPDGTGTGMALARAFGHLLLTRTLPSFLMVAIVLPLTAYFGLYLVVPYLTIRYLRDQHYFTGNYLSLIRGEVPPLPSLWAYMRRPATPPKRPAPQISR